MQVEAKNALFLRDLEPDTWYELKISKRYGDGYGHPKRFLVLTNSAGEVKQYEQHGSVFAWEDEHGEPVPIGEIESKDRPVLRAAFNTAAAGGDLNAQRDGMTTAVPEEVAIEELVPVLETEHPAKEFWDECFTALRELTQILEAEDPRAEDERDVHDPWESFNEGDGDW